MLEQALSQDTASVQTTAGTESIDNEYVWDDLAYAGGTNIYWEGPETEFYGATVGKVQFKNEIRVSSEHDRAALRSFIRMNPGRSLCEEQNQDKYCIGDIYRGSGYRNKRTEVRHDWDQPINEFDASELLTDMKPEGQLEDVEKTDTFSLGMGISGIESPELSVGYSSSISMSGAGLYEVSLLPERVERALSEHHETVTFCII
jgi:hypothetical protein